MPDAMPVLGPFQLGRTLGEGAAGVVYHAVHQQSGTKVAIKVLRRVSAGTNLRHEARVAAGLHHPSVVRVLDAGTIEHPQPAHGWPAGTGWIAMELVDGGALSDRRDAGWPQLRRWLAQVLEGLSHAHARGVLHRDIKPSNLLIDGVGHIRIADFGLAASRGARARRHGGSRGYCPPNSEILGPWVDLFAVGGVAIWALTGEHPTPNQRDIDHALNVPAELRAWVRNLRAPVGTRFASALAARNALVGEQPVDARSVDGSTVVLALAGVGAGLLDVRALPMLARESEQAALVDALFDVVQRHEPVFVRVHGPAGVGKSRLCAWLSAHAYEHLGVQPLHAVYARSPGPGQGLGGMLARWAGVLGLPPGEAMARTEARLERVGIVEELEVDRVLDMVLPEVSYGRGALERITDEARYATVARVLEALSAHGATVVWLDDVQWDDDAGRFASWVRHSRPDLAALVLLAERRGPGAVPQPVVHDEEVLVPLHPLAAGVGVAQALLGVTPQVAQRVADRAEGIPLFVVQLLKAWLQQGAVAVVDGIFAVVDEGALVVPDSIHALWIEQLSGLSDTHRRGLELVAALGSPVDGAEWRAIAEDLDADPVLRSLQDRGLLREEDGALTVVHGLLAESVERLATEAGRWSAHHRRCAQMLEHRYGERHAPSAERKARHLGESGQQAAQVDALLLALAHHYETGRPAPGMRVGVQLDRLLHVVYPSQNGPSSQRCEHHRLMGGLRSTQGESRKAVEEHSLAVAEAEALEDPLLMGLTHCDLALAGRDGSATRSVDSAQRAYDLLMGLGDLEGIGKAVHARAVVLLWEGHQEQARPYYERALQLFAELGQGSRVQDCLGGLAEVAKRSGDIDGARSYTQKSNEQARQLKLYDRVAMAENVLGDLHRYEGNLDAAATCYKNSLRMARQNGVSTGRVATFGRLNLAVVSLALDRPGEALEQLALVERRLVEAGAVRLLVAVHANQVLAHALANDANALRIDLDRFAAVMRQHPLFDRDNADALERAAGMVSGDAAGELWRAAAVQWEGVEQPDRAALARERADGDVRA